MLILIVLRAAGAGSGEGAGVGAVVGVSGAGAGGMRARPVERGTGVSPDICSGAHVWIRKELRNSTKLGSGKICSSLRLRALMDCQYHKVQSCTDQRNLTEISVFLLNCSTNCLSVGPVSKTSNIIHYRVVFFQSPISGLVDL